MGSYFQYFLSFLTYTSRSAETRRYLSIITILLLLVVVIRSYVKTKVNCWFCNSNAYVPYHRKNSWICPKCQQYNGFNSDGDYNHVIEDQYSSSNKKLYTKYSRNDGVKLRSSNLLCEKCNKEQERKIKQLKSFNPLDDGAKYDNQLAELKEKLESDHALCSQCSINVENYLQRQDEFINAMYNYNNNKNNTDKRFHQTMFYSSLYSNNNQKYNNDNKYNNINDVDKYNISNYVDDNYSNYNYNIFNNFSNLNFVGGDNFGKSPKSSGFFSPYPTECSLSSSDKKNMKNKKSLSNMHNIDKPCQRYCIKSSNTSRLYNNILSCLQYMKYHVYTDFNVKIINVETIKMLKKFKNIMINIIHVLTSAILLKLSLLALLFSFWDCNVLSYSILLTKVSGYKWLRELLVLLYENDDLVLIAGNVINSVVEIFKRRRTKSDILSSFLWVMTMFLIHNSDTMFCATNVKVLTRLLALTLISSNSVLSFFKLAEAVKCVYAPKISKFNHFGNTCNYKNLFEKYSTPPTNVANNSVSKSSVLTKDIGCEDGDDGEEDDIVNESGKKLNSLRLSSGVKTNLFKSENNKFRFFDQLLDASELKTKLNSTSSSSSFYSASSSSSSSSPLSSVNVNKPLILPARFLPNHPVKRKCDDSFLNIKSEVKC